MLQPIYNVKTAIMFEHILHINEEKELVYVSDLIIENYLDQKLILLHGDLGAGKTTLVKSFLKSMGFEGLVQSPTYGIVNEYKFTTEQKEQKVFHIDLYRIKHPTELVEFGFEEYLMQDALVLIEWPDIGNEYYPEEHLEIYLSLDDDKGRKISIKANRKN